MIQVGFISTLGRLREVDHDQVARLAESIKEVGLLNPITVYRREIIRNGQTVDGYGLVAGAHRLEACKSLGWSDVPAVIVDLTDDDRIIAECDENLCAPKVTASEQAMFTSKRKEAYLRKHPETGHGAPGVSRQVGDTRDRSASDRFTKETADRTGHSERSIQRNAERGKNVTLAALAMVKGTKLDTGAFLDKLKKIKPEGQCDYVQKALEESAKPKPKLKPKPDPDPEPIPDPYGYAKLTEEALLDLANGLRADLDDEKAKRKKAEAKLKDATAKLADMTADDKDEVIRRLQAEAKNAGNAKWKAIEDRDAYHRQVHALKKRVAELEAVEVPL